MAGREEKVVEIWHDLNIGPIDPSDPAGRAKWLEKEIGPENIFTSERAALEADYPDQHKVAWFTRRSAMEYAGFLGWLWHRGDTPCDIVDLTDVEIKYPLQTEPPGPWRLPSLALLPYDIIHRNKLWDLCRPLPMTERLKHRELWQQCLAENAPLRVIEDGKLASAPISFFDPLLIYHIGRQWQSIARVFSSVTNFHWEDGVWQTNDAFLAARIRTLVESGQLEIRGHTGLLFTRGEVRQAQKP
jgi:hypothetical protein